MELKIKDIRSLNMLVEALSLNGYTLETAVMWKQFPEKGIDYFVLGVKDGDTNG